MEFKTASFNINIKTIFAILLSCNVQNDHNLACPLTIIQHVLLMHKNNMDFQHIRNATKRERMNKKMFCKKCF